MCKSFEKMMSEFEKNVSNISDDVANWIREYVENSGAKGVVLGMSGGVDCSCVAALVKKAGIDVLLVEMPYGKSMEFCNDNKDVDSLVNKFGFDRLKVDITEEVDKIRDNINNVGIDVSEMAMANIMPRVRMTNLYAIAQSKGMLVIGTGNASESYMGYSTKFGDSACDLNPLGSFVKSEVRILAKELGVPERIINKSPSANLWEGQTDEEEMGVTYYEIDKFLITGEGATDIIDRMKRLYKQSEHKRVIIPMYRREVYEERKIR